jgi:hypothetical protein
MHQRCDERSVADKAEVTSLLRGGIPAKLMHLQLRPKKIESGQHLLLDSVTPGANA